MHLKLRRTKHQHPCSRGAEDCPSISIQQITRLLAEENTSLDSPLNMVPDVHFFFAD